MILILGGTTEGRIAVEVAAEAVQPYYYSTRGEGQQIDTPHGEHIIGAMDRAAMESFCRTHGIRLLLDAAHPFAEELHRTVAAVAQQLEIPALRLERQFQTPDTGVVWCEDFPDAVRQLKQHGIKRLLALTGVQTIGKLRDYWLQNETMFRILDRPESIKIAIKEGFPKDKLLFFHTGDDERALLRNIRPEAVITKESGQSGFFNEKVKAAREAGIPLFVVRRPPLPTSLERVQSAEGLRRRIEELLPGYFPLRSGYTTGTCATAAARAALERLLDGETPNAVTLRLPCGVEAQLPIESSEAGADWASACVRKEAGDDPDATNHCLICVRIAPNDRHEISFLPGEGVGRVTLPGLGIEIGEPAINATPRRMIREALETLYAQGLDVTISVTGGRAIAAKTFNPKLGIVDGISIIGTSGIVRPFSNEAFVASIRKEIDVARAVGCRRLIINSGAKSESYIRREFPTLSPQAFVHYGNFIGETLTAASEAGFQEVTMGIMIGKAVKLAEGHLDTHSKKTEINRDFLQTLAARSGCTAQTLARIASLTLARELWTLPAAERDKLMPALLRECLGHCAPLLGAGHLSILLITDQGEIPYRL